MNWHSHRHPLQGAAEYPPYPQGQMMCVLTDLTFLFFVKPTVPSPYSARCDMGLSSLGLCSLEQGSKGSSSQADRAGVACRWGTPWTIYVAFSPELRRKLL